MRQDWARRELARLVPEVDPEWIAVGDINPARLAQAIELQLASLAAAAPAGDAPCGFVVEDLQFADAESVHLLRLVAQSVPLAWLFSARTQSPTSPAPAWLALAEPATARRLGLQPLDAAATLELMQSLELAEVDAAALAGRVHRHTGGNPMFVLETLSALLAAPSADRAAAAHQPQTIEYA